MIESKPEDRILEAALDVVKEKTISGTRMHLIAKQVDMAQSNLHYYFKTKDDLLLGLHNKVLQKCHELREEDKSNASDDLESQLDVFFNQKRQFILNYKKYDFAEVDFWVQTRTNPKIQKAFIESFQGWRNDIGKIIETYIPDLSDKNKEFIPAMMVSMLEGATMQYLIDENSFDLDKYFAFCKSGILKIIENI
ncbi:MAG: TetR/AcrR family transcriptional regulator [Lachnotalea sp.]